MFYHNNSIYQALEDIFPNIIIAHRKNCTTGVFFLIIIFVFIFCFWFCFCWLLYTINILIAHEEMSRNFFEKYAKTQNFDPQVASNWYSQSLTRLAADKVF